MTLQLLTVTRKAHGKVPRSNLVPIGAELVASNSLKGLKVNPRLSVAVSSSSTTPSSYAHSEPLNLAGSSQEEQQEHHDGNQLEAAHLQAGLLDG
jgi:hypothetical protein